MRGLNLGRWVSMQIIYPRCYSEGLVKCVTIASLSSAGNPCKQFIPRLRRQNVSPDLDPNRLTL